MCGDVVRPGPPPFLCMWPSSHPAPPSLGSVVQHLLPPVSAYTYTPVRPPGNTIQMPKLDAAVFPGFLLLLHASHLARISLLPIYLLKNLCLFLLELSSVFIISSLTYSSLFYAILPPHSDSGSFACGAVRGDVPKQSCYFLGIELGLCLQDTQGLRY